MTKILLACYGTLRKDMEQAWRHERSGARYLGTGATEEPYNLFQASSWFPSISLKHNSNGKPVVVDLYEVDEDKLPIYDQLEGYPGFYSRSHIPVIVDGNRVTALIYHLDEVTGPVIESGDWTQRQE